MGLPDFSIRKPVSTVMIFTGVMLFGVISLIKLPQELFPPITYPQLTVFTGYANAAPEEVETLLTRPIEEAVGTVSGLKSVTSISKEGSSLVIGEFDWDQNMDFASLRTREKVDLVKARLPRDASEPLVVPFNPFEMPIMTISVTGNRPPAQLRRIATDIIKEEMEKVDGVASASVEGGLEREIIVEVDQGKLKTYGVSITEVSDAISNSNLNYPAGTIKESFYEYLIRTLGEFKDVGEIEDVVVKGGTREEDQRAVPFEQKLAERKISSQANMVLIRDVAKVEDTFKERSSYSRFNGKENVSLAVQKQAQANTIQVINKINAAFLRLKKILPPDIEIKVTYDQSIFIRSAINGVRDAAWQGGILVFIVLLAFLRKLVPSAIVTLSIPISIMVTFTCMFFSGLSINMMSLGGLALGVGMLVDNGIVVIENIFRRRELGESGEESAVKGANEVVGAIMASTLTTIAVFLPMIFIVGVTGQIFKELSFTVTFSLCASIWVALTLIPLLSCKLGGSKEKAAEDAKAFSGGKKWKEFLDKFESVIRIFLKHKGKGLLIILGAFIATLFLTVYLEKELMPKADQGQFIIKADMRVGTTLGETDKAVRHMEDKILTYPEVSSVSSIVGSTKGSSAKDVIKRLGANQGQLMIDLKDKRKRTTADIVQLIQKDFKRDKGLKDVAIEFSLQQGVMAGAFGGGGKAIVLEIKGDKLDIMEDIAYRVKAELAKIPGIFGVEDDVPEPSPEVRLNVDKDKASLYNISVVDLAKVAQTVLRGYVPSQFKEKGREVDIRVRLREADRDSYDELYRIRIPSPGGEMVPLGTVAKFEQGKGPSEIKRVSQERTMLVFADCFGRKIADVNKEIENMLKGMKFEPGYRVKLAGETEEMKKSFDSMIFALVLSIVLVYMIMAAQFESIIQPLIILFTLPLSIIGVILALFVTGTSLNVISLLGVLVLGGVVVNNAIVLIDFTNILMREKGMSAFEAIVEASKARLRPILMTALTTILGLIPMAIATGKGSELSSPMAISIMGGMTVSTFLTLGVVPAIFMFDQDIRAKLRKRFAKKQ